MSLRNLCAPLRLRGCCLLLCQKLAATKEKATVSSADVKDGVAFLESLKSRAKRPEVREAISIVNRRLKRADGQTVDAILKRLAKSKPPKLKLNPFGFKTKR